MLLVACGSGPDSEIALKEVRDEAYGYVIKVPEPATQTERENGRHVWNWTFNRQIDSYHCIVQPEPALTTTFTPDAARSRVALVRNDEEIKRVEARGADGLLVELAEDEQFHYRESWFFRRGPTTTMLAICQGPGKGRTVTTMATSLRATK